jgi:hypothetical protein
VERDAAKSGSILRVVSVCTAESLRPAGTYWRGELDNKNDTLPRVFIKRPEPSIQRNELTKSHVKTGVD